MKVSSELLEKYFKRFCTEAERKAVEATLTKNETPEFDAYFLGVIQDIPPFAEQSTIAQKEKKRLFRKLYKHGVRPIYMKYAAAVILLMTLGAATYLVFSKQPDASIATADKTDWVQIKNTSTTAVKKINMTDGSIVYLNTNASLNFNKALFDKKYREVQLEGEAYFEIFHDPTKPFIVQTRDISTTVKGTKFNIEAYKNEKEVYITLIEGKVVVQQKNKRLAMKPDERLSVDDRMNFNLKNTTAVNFRKWIGNGDLLFDHIPLESVLNRISRLYDVPIIADQEVIRNKYVQGQFKRQSLEHTLKKVLFIHNLHFQKTDTGSIVIKK